MGPIDIIIVAIIAAIIGFVTFYIIKAKKSGRKCIGCPDSSTCGKSTNKQSCCCGCNSCSYKESCPTQADSNN